MRWSSPAVPLVALVALVALAPIPSGARGLPSDPGPASQRARTARTPERGQLLVASRRMRDPRFRRTVILIARHEETGTLGLIVNRPTSRRVGEFLPSLEGLDRANPELHFGGPVATDRLLYVFRQPEKPADAVPVVGDLYLAASLATLQQLLKAGKSEKELRVYVGHAGWAPGQLEGELGRGDWHLHPGDAKTVLEHEPGSIWRELIERREPGGRLVRASPGPGPASGRPVAAGRCPSDCGYGSVLTRRNSPFAAFR